MCSLSVAFSDAMNCLKTKCIAFVMTLIIVGCASQPPDVHSASTAQLLERRTEIDRKLREDDFGVAWGVTRWISHASEKDSVLKEKAAMMPN